MDLLEGIATRRSTKNFKPDPVPRDILAKIIEAGSWAPSGQNLQPVRFWIIDDPTLLKEVEADIFAFGKKLKKMLLSEF